MQKIFRPAVPSMLVPALLAVLLAAGACGQKGDLYLPNHPQPLAADSAGSAR